MFEGHLLLWCSHYHQELLDFSDKTNVHNLKEQKQQNNYVIKKVQQ